MKTKILLFLAVTLFSFSQSYDNQCLITGKITDENGEALIGANVLVKGTSQGTVTDLDGKYSIEVPDCKNATLIISYTGFTDKEVKIKNKSVVDIKLGAAVELDEVVVTSLRKPRFKKDIAASHSIVSADALSGKVAGVRRSNRKNKHIKIRGYANPSVPHTGYLPAPNENKEQFNTEDYDHITENRFLEVQQNPLSTFSIDVDAASYSNMRRFIQNGQVPPKDAVRIEEMVNYFNYDYPKPFDEHPFQVVTEVSDCPWNSKNKLLHIGLQGKHIPTDELPATNLVFLIDVSGSMNAPNKLPLLQSSFKLLVDQLREQDRVAIVVYAGAAGLVLPSTSGANNIKIKEAITQLRAGGSTAGGAGVILAYKVAKENFVKGGNNRVILATDGDFNIGASSDADLVRLIEKERESGVFLTVMGFGMGNYKDNKMQKLANKGNGNHAYIDNINEAKKVLVNEFGGTLFTIAKDVKLQLEFNPTKVQGYRLIGYENRMLNKEDFNDDKKDAGELGSGHTVTAMYEIIPAGVKSDFLASVDNLKYQQNKVKKTANQSEELLTIKLRYKKPDGNKSKLIEKPLIDNQIDLKQSSNNFRWAAAVAEFGMLLRESEFKSDANFNDAIKLAKSAKGKDPNGYRKELINMMEVMQSIVSPQVANK